MTLFKKSLLFFVLIGTLTSTHAQKTPAKKIKLPKLTTSLANVSDSLVTINVELARSIIGNPLKVMDDKMKQYKILYYDFLYKRKAVKEDEATGKISATTTIAEDHFTTSPLPALWTNIIKDQLKSGEELYFFDIIVQNDKGAAMYAPNLKILIQ